MTAVSDTRLEAIARRELWPLTAGEKARIARAAVGAGIAIKRGKAPARAGRALDQVFADAEARVREEIAAEQRAQDLEARQKAKQQAKKKAERGSLWW